MVKKICMFISHCFLTSAWVCLKHHVLRKSLENSVHKNLPNISSPVPEIVSISKSSCRQFKWHLINYVTTAY